MRSSQEHKHPRTTDSMDGIDDDRDLFTALDPRRPTYQGEDNRKISKKKTSLSQNVAGSHVLPQKSKINTFVDVYRLNNY